MADRDLKLVRQDRRGNKVFLVGNAGLMTYGDGVGSPKRSVSDGDTVSTRALANIPLRFLGVDAPEKGLYRKQGNEEVYTAITNPSWDGFLQQQLSAMSGDLTPALQTYLQNLVQPGVSANHAHHAKEATEALEALVQDDLEFYQKDNEGFTFYLAFANEALDTFGRLLCFAAPYVPNPTADKPRRPSYNTRMLEEALVSPYFIWPNVDPFREQQTPFGEVLAPARFWAEVNASNTLQRARTSVKSSRSSGKGLYETANPLQLLAFELRYLNGGRPPQRFVIDLFSEGNRLLEPQRYIDIAFPEDRLFVPAEYVPLFVHHGWTI